MTTMEQIIMDSRAPYAVGSFVLVPFGDGRTQIGHLTGYTRTGKVKVRAWNRAQGRWMPNTRTLEARHLKGGVDAAAARLLPAPPSI